MVAESAVRIGVLLPDLLGTYGDTGNAVVLRQRLRWRGIAAHLVPLGHDTAVPESCDLYVLGGGEDSAQVLATRHLNADGGLRRAVGRGAVVLAVCAGLQVLGESFATADGTTVPGLGLLDLTTGRRAVRAVGEVLAAPATDLLATPLTGFENHGGATALGPDARPLAHVRRGVGNGSNDRTEGAITGRVVGTYLHGPVLARNPELADLLLGWVTGIPLTPLELPEVTALRARCIGRHRSRG